MTRLSPSRPTNPVDDVDDETCGAPVDWGSGRATPRRLSTAPIHDSTSMPLTNTTPPAALLNSRLPWTAAIPPEPPAWAPMLLFVEGDASPGQVIGHISGASSTPQSTNRQKGSSVSIGMLGQSSGPTWPHNGQMSQVGPLDAGGAEGAIVIGFGVGFGVGNSVRPGVGPVVGGVEIGAAVGGAVVHIVSPSANIPIAWLRLEMDCSQSESSWKKRLPSRLHSHLERVPW